MTDRPTNPTDRPALRSAAPEHESVNGTRPTDIDRPTIDTDRKPRGIARLLARRADRPKKVVADQSTTPAPTAPTVPAPTMRTVKPTDQPRRWRPTKPTANRPASTIDPTVIAAMAADHRRPTTPTTTNRPTNETDIAPVPHKLKWLGVWLDRTFGAMPLLAPLLVSGYYTTQVFTGDPIDAHPTVAVLAACALEGGVWKLSRLYEKTLVAGDSTMALRLGIGAYLVLISGLIYWHADHTAKLNQAALPNPDGQIGLGVDALPAFGVAVMSALGVFIWSRTARWTRRRELHAQGRVDTQAPKFAALAWILCPFETPQALRHAVKYRLAGPVEAVADLRLYKAAGKPAVWPPKRPTDSPTNQSTDRPTDVPTGQTRRPTVEPTRPAAQPTRPQPTSRTTDRPTVAPRPTAPAPRPQPAAIRPTTPVPTATTTGTTDRPDYTPAAIRNAAIIRNTYGTTTDLRLGTVRSDLRWSFDRADPALKAYLAGADRTDQTEADQDLARTQ